MSARRCTSIRASGTSGVPRSGRRSEDTSQRRVEIPLAADPAPLGLAAFALTTFPALPAENAGGRTGERLAGVRVRLRWPRTAPRGHGEFEPQRVRRGRVLHVRVVLDRPGDLRLLRGGGGSPNALNDLGFILLAFAIFNTYMLIWSSRVNVAVFLVFLTLGITEIVLSVGFFSGSDTIVQTGGVIGVVTAAVAWYTSAAES